MTTLVELEGVNGDVIPLTGPEAAERGVILAPGGLQGIYDPPVKVVFEEPANFPGARYLHHRIMRRDVIIGVDIYDDGPGTLLQRDSEFRKMWDYKDTSKLHVTTDDYGTRTLTLQMSEQPEYEETYDLNEVEVTQVKFTTTAVDPFWYSEDETFLYTTKTDTTDGSLEEFVISVPEVNPTDQPIWPKWEASAPAKWTIPDYSWLDNELANRRIVMPTLVIGEDLEIDADPRTPQIVADNGAPVWARMNGIRFRHPVPKYTGQRDFHCRVTLAPVDSVLQLRLPRPWSRPWGLF